MYSTFNIDNTSWLTFKMFSMILQTLFGFIVIQGICSKSIQNVTIDDNKVVTTDMLENWKKNMTDWMTELFERKFSSWFFSQKLFKSSKSCKLMKYLFVYYAAGGLLVPEGIICPVVSVSALISFISIYLLLKFQFLNHVIIIKIRHSSL